MGTKDFIWHSFRIPSVAEIEKVREKEARETEKLIQKGHYTRSQAQARARGIYLASVPLLFVLVGVISGFVGSLMSGVVSHFLEAEQLAPLAEGNRGWTAIAAICALLLIYIALWASRVQRLYRARSEGSAEGAGLDIQ